MTTDEVDEGHANGSEIPAAPKEQTDATVTTTNADAADDGEAQVNLISKQVYFNDLE